MKHCYSSACCNKAAYLYLHRSPCLLLQNDVQILTKSEFNFQVLEKFKMLLGLCSGRAHWIWTSSAVMRAQALQ